MQQALEQAQERKRRRAEVSQHHTHQTMAQGMYFLRKPIATILVLIHVHVRIHMTRVGGTVNQTSRRGLVSKYGEQQHCMR